MPWSYVKIRPWVEKEKCRRGMGTIYETMALIKERAGGDWEEGEEND